MCQEVIKFWFEEIKKEQWFAKDKKFDQTIQERFQSLHKKAINCELYEWRQSPLGRLAEIIILDQFSRNIFREQKEAFDYDALALALSQEAIHVQANQELNPPQKAFLYMPWMHSESQKIHEKAMQLFSEPGLEHNLDFEKKHKRIIDRFGRYPHRNNILGRSSTEEEIEFLKEENSSF
ncbi:MAG: DUF924 domain-containing protein [Deltaproteobacteria bacterium]|nr:DUF924 domain-containing protein [Deltaproteobacteria bacterium]